MLYIAEKKEVANAIALALGEGKQGRGFITCGKDTVTWCVGHLLQIPEPEECDAKYSQWTELPIRIFPPPKKPIERTKDQCKIVLELIKNASIIVNAGDPDAEGQLLVDELLEYANYKGPVKRILINDLNATLVKRAIENMQDNSVFTGLSQSALARQYADWIYGHNMTRLYTTAARAAGYNGDVLSVGRVQTPVLGLVYNRTMENSNHKQTKYYNLVGQFDIKGIQYTGRYQPIEDDPKDGEGRINDPQFAESLSSKLTGQGAEVVSSTTVAKETPPPLPYNLIRLQMKASDLYKMKPDKVKTVTQSLRETHKAITYNRSDCEYLSNEAFNDAPEVLEAIAKTNPDLVPLIEKANVTLRGRAFDSEKVTAHHAIIPSGGSPDFNKFSPDEKRIYNLIATVYIAQFYPPTKFNSTTILTRCGESSFVTTSTTVTDIGWKALYTDEPSGDKDDDNTDSTIDLTSLSDRDAGKCVDITSAEKTTKPRPLFTVSSLLNEMTKIAEHIEDPRLRKILIDKDRGKKGEHGGIGTPATRDTIIAKLFDRGFIEEVKVGKSERIRCTDRGAALYNTLPSSATNPVMSAIWEEEQRLIELKSKTVSEFIDGVFAHITAEIDNVRTNGLKMDITVYHCPSCNKPMNRFKNTKKTGFYWRCTDRDNCGKFYPDKNGEPDLDTKDNFTVTDIPCPACAAQGGLLVRREGKYGPYYGCSRYRDGCKSTFKEKDGKPVLTVATSNHKCTDCGLALVKRTNSKKKTEFWACSGYPKCKKTFPDKNGEPLFPQEKENL